MITGFKAATHIYKQAKQHLPIFGSLKKAVIASQKHGHNNKRVNVR
jgi:hypothetical protein